MDKAYPFIELNKNGETRFDDVIDGKRYTVHWDAESHSGRIFDEQGKDLPVVQAFWFAWYTFHPQTQVYTAEESETP